MKTRIGNRVTEKDVRDWLNENGYYGNGAQFHELELFAISRPGWIQVFQFMARIKTRPTSEAPGEVTADSPIDIDPSSVYIDPSSVFYGVVRDDERKPAGKKLMVELYRDQNQRDEVLEKWSSDLIVANAKGNSSALIFIVLVGLVFVLVAAGVSFFKSMLG